MSYPKISVQVVTHQSLRFLPFLLKSLKEQDFDNFSILIIDNASTDGTLKFLKENYPEIPVFRNKVNLGYSKAHNQGIRLTKSKYVLCLNPDIVLKRDFLSTIIKPAERNSLIGGIGPCLYKVRFADQETRHFLEKTDIFDSTGLVISKSLSFNDRGQGQKDKGQYSKQEPVFGVSGACFLLRRKALEDIKYQQEYFDEDFFAYKEDIDLSWRLQHRGWLIYYNPKAKAYHFRQTPAYSQKKKFYFDIPQQFKKSFLVSCLSWRNHLWVILKNCSLKLFISCFFPFVFFQKVKALWLLFYCPKALFYGYFSFWGKFFKMLKKRRYIFSRLRINNGE